MHIFISYAKKDTRELALKLREIFNSLPTVTAWMDDSLEYGASWAQQIANQIKRCDLFVVLISEDVNREETATQDRSFVLTEIDYAKYEFRKPILPVLVQKTPLPIQLAGAQYIDFTRNQDAGIEKLVEEVCKRAGIETPRQQQEREHAEEKARQKALDEEQKRLKEQTAEKKRRESREQAIKYEAYRAKTPLPMPSAKSSSQKFWFGGVGVALLLLVLGIVFLSDTPLLTREASNAPPTQIPSEFKTATKIIQNATATQAALTYTPPPLAPQFLTATTIIRGATETQAALLNPLLPNQLTATAFIQNATSTQEALTNPYTPPTLAPPYLTATTIIRNATETQVASNLAATGIFQTATAIIQNETATQLAVANLAIREQAIQLAQAGVNSNDEWTPYSEVIDGVEMVLVPKGCFMMGSSDAEIDYALTLYEGAERIEFANEQPQHQQCFDAPFWIDKYEVTNAQFRQFNGQAANSSFWTEDGRPRESITWFEARDFCESRGARLPTEKEWEYAARGVDNLIFPWGNEFVADNVVFGDNSNQTANVGSRERGASWVGVLDISGNVWEWISTIYNEQYPYSESFESNSDTNNARGLRGGSWEFITFYVRAAVRGWNFPSYKDFYVGVRCARSF